jgi:hypothetical protein
VISFRFHVVSITAVFLAIAIGVVVGSTFVDRAIVDGLRDRIETVEDNLDDRLVQIDRLNDEVDRLNDVADTSAPFAVSGRLADRHVLVLAVRGVDDEPARRFVDLAVQAGATAPGILWVEPRWALEGDDEGTVARQLASLVGSASSSPDVVRSIVWDAAVEELAGPVLPPEQDEPAATTTTAPDGTTTTTEPRVAEITVLTALVDGGFLSFEPAREGAALDDVADTSPALVAVTGPRGDTLLQPLLQPLVSVILANRLPVVVAEAFVEPGDDEADAPERGETALAAVPQGGTAQVSVVDHFEQPIGQVAAVLAAADAFHAVSGHYGFGDGAASLLPTWTPL